MGEKLLLNKYVHYAQLDDVDVLLDAEHNRYLSLSGQQSRWLTEFVANDERRPLSSDAERFQQRLIERGVLVTDTRMGKPIASFSGTDATSSIHALHVGKTNVRTTDMVLIIRTYLECSFEWRRHNTRIDKLLDCVESWKSECNQQQPDHDLLLVDSVRMFDQFLPYICSTHDRCFFRSLLLSRFLSHKRLPFEFVIGVRTCPFSAHCWVENDGVILNDFLETVLSYSKILAV